MNSTHQHYSSADPSGSRGAGGIEASGREFLTFRLGAEEYGIDILKVQEIRGWEPPTAIANMPEFIKGVVNLRGIIVPIIDLRVKFRLKADYDATTVAIILSVAKRVMGVVVDSVSDVITLGPAQMHAAPQFAGVLDTHFITGMGAVDGRMLILLDIEKLMTSRDMQLVDAAAESA